ncbi:helicase HerA-like domain-containing protein [Pelagibius sp. Alg239-R121]|uniref:helicase HerA-like domain-containing protein n=1 Tax=Pelagibius sp. Alg239-R121 TaxID=2993448 RepID=UPI0024A68B5D|nr:helicase HerA-like domain-containing protein [Pelagibius sp. Alg239-R121]
MKNDGQNDGTIFIGGSGKPQTLSLKFANRHGLIAGATGTGKTVTLQILAEGFSKAGVPVFLSDAKGDLSGISQTGKPNPKLEQRAAEIGLGGFDYSPSPTVFWDLFGKKGHPIRTTVSEMGPLLLARLLELNDTQEGVLNIAFELADDQGMLILDLKDLRALLAHVAENARELSKHYGNVSSASVGAIQRRLLTLKQQGAEKFFGEPALELSDFMQYAPDGSGQINILAADKLMMTPRLYATFLLWLLSELFEELPEIGDPEKPKLVFFFDEAHLLFNDAPKALVEKVEQVVRLIRSKGVGIYFVTQNPLDVPESILGQLGNRVQHALRAFTPRDQKAVKAAAETFRANKSFDAAVAITELGVGEALVSTLSGKGIPTVVQRTKIRPPSSRMGPAKPAERKATMASSPLAGHYDKAVDRRSAYEVLNEKADRAAREAEEREEAERAAKSRKAKAKTRTPARRTRRKRSSRRQSVGETLMKSVVRSLGSNIGRQLVRGLLGSLFKGR